MSGWKYYNHAAIPSFPPHEIVNLEDLESGAVWRQYPQALLARWTEDFDCGYETNWWYIIKDTPFDINKVKSDYRYKIRKGLKNFDVRVIRPSEYIESLFNVHANANKTYPKKNQSVLSYETYCQTVKKWESDRRVKVYAAFSKETNELCGFILGTFYNSFFELTSQKADPTCEKLQINAAMVYTFLNDNVDLLENGIYCNDGARSINHETNFQEYLENYFGFRKAFCHLKIKYNPRYGWIIKCFFPFRGIFCKLDQISFAHKVNALLKMEEIKRKNE